MYPSEPQSAAVALMLSDRLCVGPPSSGATRSLVPPTMKPTDRPSGEKNGDPAPSVPEIGVEISLSWSRTQSRPLLGPGPTYTRRCPSGEIATRLPDWVTLLTAWSGGRKTLKRLTAGAGPGRSQPQAASAAAARRPANSPILTGSSRVFAAGAGAARAAVAAVRAVEPVPR